MSLTQLGVQNCKRRESKRIRERQKHYYDRKMCCQKLIIGDVVLVKEKGSSSNYKINDKWEMNPYTVLEHMKDNEGKQMPVF